MKKTAIFFVGVFVILIGLFSLYIHKQIQADGTYANIGTASSSSVGADAVNWATETDFLIDPYGNYIHLFEDSGGGYHFAYSNDKGATWGETSTLSGVGLRPTTVYDSTDDTIHMLFEDGATGVSYRRFIIYRNSKYQVTNIVQDASVTPLTLDSDSSGGCTSLDFRFPILKWKNTGSHGILIALWSVKKTCGGVSITESRASMRVLSNTSADGTGSNWAALNGTSDASGATGPADVAYNKLYGYVGSASEPFQEALVIPGGGAHPDDLYFFNIDETTTHGFRRLAWNSGSSNWSGTWTTRTTFGGNINDTKGYGLKKELMSKAVYDSTHDRVYVGIARWLDDTNGDTDSLFYVNSSDTVSSAIDVYSAGGAHCIYPTFDISYDSTADKVYIFYDKSGAASVCGNVDYKTYDGSTLSGVTAFYSVANRSVDVPTTYENRYNGQMLLFFRLNNASTPGTPPHELYFGYVTLGSAIATSVSASGSPYTNTTFSDFDTSCDTNSNTQVTNNSGGEVSLLSGFRDDFETPRAPYTHIFSDWSTGVWSSGTYYPSPNGSLLVYNSGGAYALGTHFFTQKSLEFRAKFTNNVSQHIGWVDDTDFSTYLIFSTHANGQLNARVSDNGSETEVGLGSSYYGSFHTYRIDWTGNAINFLIDGAQVASIPQTVSRNLTPIMSNADGAVGSNLTIDWITVLNYPSTTGTYTSCAVSSGIDNATWGTISYNDSNTGSFTVETRTSNDNSSWSSWSSALSSGNTIPSPAGKYIQYQVAVTGTSTTTPTFNDISLAFSAPVPTSTPTPIPTATPGPTSPPSSSSSSNSDSGTPDPNSHPGWAYVISAGPTHLGNVSFIPGSGNASDALIYIGPNASHNDVHVDIRKVGILDLLFAPKRVPFPWMQGYNTVSDIYTYNIYAAFNGLRIDTFDNPVTVVLHYNTTLWWVNPTRFRIGWFDPTARRWKVVGNKPVLNRVNKTIADVTKHSGFFTILYQK